MAANVAVNGAGTDRASAPSENRFDAVVIGGGSAGLSFAKRAADLGARVALIEKRELGGTCVNRGCVPKKMLWHVAHARRAAASFAKDGEFDADPHVDYGRLHQTVANHLETIRQSYRDTLNDKNVELVHGEARIVEEDGEAVVHVGEQTLHARSIVIACGGQPARPDLPGIELGDTSDEAFGWTAPPKRLVVVGGGYIGVEFSTVYSAFGTAITLCEHGDEILEGFDPDAVALTRKHLARDGIEVLTGTGLEAIERDGDDLVACLNGDRRISCDKVLVAVGRTINLEPLGAIAAGLERAGEGSGPLAVSDAFETSRPGLFAIGDAADRMPLTPVARRDGAWLADHLFGEAGARLDLGLVATSTFADPPIAQIGQTEADGETSLTVEHGTTAPLEDGLLTEEREPTSEHGSNGGEALEPGHSLTLFKLLTDGEGGALRGTVLVSRTAPDEIAWAGAAIAAGVPSDTLRRPAPVHPSVAEEYMG